MWISIFRQTVAVLFIIKERHSSSGVGLTTSEAILSKEQCVVVYIDFSKAFDVVSHTKLIARLNSYGTRGAVLKWIENFLTDRTHCTRVDNVLS